VYIGTCTFNQNKNMGKCVLILNCKISIENMLTRAVRSIQTCGTQGIHLRLREPDVHVLHDPRILPHVKQIDAPDDAPTPPLMLAAE
jgi:hypothetical protein